MLAHFQTLDLIDADNTNSRVNRQLRDATGKLHALIMLRKQLISGKKYFGLCFLDVRDPPTGIRPQAPSPVDVSGMMSSAHSKFNPLKVIQ